MTFRALTAIEADIGNELVVCGGALKYEFIAILDEAGNDLIDFRTDRKKGGAYVGLAALAEMSRSRRVVVRHNHLRVERSMLGRSLSIADWNLVSDNPYIREISAHCEDGTIFRGAIPNASRLTFAEARKRIGEAENLASNQINAVNKAPFDLDLLDAPDLLSMHAVNEAMRQLGLVEYEVSAGSQWAVATCRVTTYLDAAVMEAKKAFE